MKLFEDLPSTNTPINPENLNQIKDKLVIVSSTEPIGDNREKVWIKPDENDEITIYILNDNVYEKNTAKSRTRTLWTGSLYEIGSSITLDEALEENNIYVFTFYSLSGNYIQQNVFTYVNGYFQTFMYDGSTFSRMRLVVNGQTITVNTDSVNTAANTALIAIEKVC